MATALLAGCAPEPDPVDLPLPIDYEDLEWPPGYAPTLMWTADRKSVAVQFPDSLLTSCSQEHAADITQADDHNFTIEIKTTSDSGACLGLGHIYSETLDFPSGQVPDVPVFVDLVFPDSGKGFELTMS